MVYAQSPIPMAQHDSDSNAVLQQLAIGQTIQGIDLLEALALLQNHTRAVESGRLTEEYTVVAKEEDDSELFMQLRHKFLTQK